MTGVICFCLIPVLVLIVLFAQGAAILNARADGEE